MFLEMMQCRGIPTFKAFLIIIITSLLVVLYFCEISVEKLTTVGVGFKGLAEGPLIPSRVINGALFNCLMSSVLSMNTLAGSGSKFLDTAACTLCLKI